MLPDQEIVIRCTAGGAGAIAFDARLERIEGASIDVDGANSLLMPGRLNNGTDGNGMKCAARVRVLSRGGKVTAEDMAVRVRNADEALLLVTAATESRGFAA